MAQLPKRRWAVFLVEVVELDRDEIVLVGMSASGTSSVGCDQLRNGICDPAQDLEGYHPVSQFGSQMISLLSRANIPHW